MSGTSPASAGQDQSEVFRGVSSARPGRRARTEKGIATTSVPAFVAGAELADLGATDDRIVVLTADLSARRAGYVTAQMRRSSRPVLRSTRPFARQSC
jgi:hypothetical protein